MQHDDGKGGAPPCFAPDLVGGHPVDAQTRRDVARFRRAERQRLYALRRGLARAEAERQAETVMAGLDALLPTLAGHVVAAYWPIRGELDLRGWMGRVHAAGARVALPVVAEKGRPVGFHAWAPRCRMTRGIWNIPVPATAEPVTPDTVIVPLVGIDGACFRLGNGGGYYDMTLAGLSSRPRIVGVGHDFCRIDTIFPQPWDIPMDLAVLGDGGVMQRQPG